jgi:four helix bundle protein
MGARRYIDLIAWQKARAVNREVYRASAGWPADERFGLIRQARDASISIMANIAEGSGRGSAKDFRRFLWIANGSLFEVESHLYAALDLGFIPQLELDRIMNLCDEEGRILAGLIASLGRDEE